MDRVRFDGRSFSFYTSSVSGEIEDVTIHGDFYIDSDSIKLLSVSISDKPLYVVQLSRHQSFQTETILFKGSVESKLLEELERLKVENKGLWEEVEELSRELAHSINAIKEYNELPWYERIWKSLT